MKIPDANLILRWKYAGGRYPALRARTPLGHLTIRLSPWMPHVFLSRMSGRFLVMRGPMEYEDSSWLEECLRDAEVCYESECDRSDLLSPRTYTHVLLERPRGLPYSKAAFERAKARG